MNSCSSGILNISQSVNQFSCSVVSDSLQTHGLQHVRPPCPSPTPGVYSNLCPLSWWCYSNISSSVEPFSSRLQSFPASGCFPMSQFFASGSQSISVSASASVLPMNFQDWLPLGLTSWISLQSLSRVSLKSLLQHHSSKASNLWCSAFFIVLSRVFIVLSRVFIVLSQESSPTPQFKSIKSSVLSFLYSSTLTSLYDYWKNHSLD